MLVERTGWPLTEIAQHVRSVIVTKGAAGCEVHERDNRCIQVPGLAATSVVDPTGCGDAFRGGLLWALEQGWSTADACKLGNVLGARKISSPGPQNYRITLEDALGQFRTAYGDSLASM
jgi:adenosine kinase